MTEANPPTAAVPLITLMVALFGPDLGPYVVITLGALGGSFWAVLASPSTSRWAGLLLVVRSLITALALTAFLAGVVGKLFDIDAPSIYVVVAFAIAALGDKWLDIIESFKLRLQAAIESGGKNE